VIFAFLVRRLKWLAAIPGVPHVFDAMLLALTGLFYPARLRAISGIEAAASQLAGVGLGIHRLGGIGFFFGAKECSHLHGNGLLDCFVGRTNRDELVWGNRAAPHHIFPRSGWISFWVKSEADISPAIELIRISCAHRSFGQ
jgi:hypothetical protein